MDKEHVRGFDSIRFLAALVVAFSHGYGFDFHALVDKQDVAGNVAFQLVWLFAGTIYNGQAAVIVFFVISGFCIHYPYHQGKRFLLGEFLVRRYVRIGVPLAVCLAMAYAWFGVKPAVYVGVWSLICEIVYYTIYPILFKLRAKGVGWWLLFGVSLVAVFLAVLAMDEPERSNPGTRLDFPAFGWLLNAALGLPIWMLGCVLAERNFSAKMLPGYLAGIWGARVAVIAAGMLCNVLRFHGDRLLGFDIPLYVSLQFFAVLALYWLHAEARRYRTIAPLNVLEWAGKWSYSLYIVHPLARDMIEAAAPGTAYPRVWIVDLTVALTAAYLFYLAVERPSHQLARTLGRLARSWEERARVRASSEPRSAPVPKLVEETE